MFYFHVIVYPEIGQRHKDYSDMTDYYYYYYYHHILTGYPRHRSVFQWGPAVINYYIT